jgi:hypothetical protein
MHPHVRVRLPRKGCAWGWWDGAALNAGWDDGDALQDLVDTGRRVEADALRTGDLSRV